MPFRDADDAFITYADILSFSYFAAIFMIFSLIFSYAMMLICERYIGYDDISSIDAVVIWR